MDNFSNFDWRYFTLNIQNSSAVPGLVIVHRLIGQPRGTFESMAVDSIISADSETLLEFFTHLGQTPRIRY